MKDDNYTEFKIHDKIYGRITRFGLEIYDWGLFIFFTMASILILKKVVILAILIDISFLIFLRKYKKGKPDFYTTSLLSFLFANKILFVAEADKNHINPNP
ncbi:hypothetical protein ACMCNP_00575 [Candidatus Acidulodesulfobacterium sp. H_13]|uniref:hypothetical protein n=1 Tax=Candidatus Acidulodesulfobacterium sp. H_13 TaxID=3395470 RepID=UPI003AF72ACF